MSCWYFAVFKAIVMFYVESLYCILNISRCFENYIMRMWICCVILSIHQEKILRHSELPFMLSVEWNDETSTFCICYMFVNWNYILVPFMHKLDILDIFNNKKNYLPINKLFTVCWEDNFFILDIWNVECLCFYVLHVCGMKSYWFSTSLETCIGSSSSDQLLSGICLLSFVSFPYIQLHLKNHGMNVNHTVPSILNRWRVKLIYKHPHIMQIQFCSNHDLWDQAPIWSLT